MTLVLVIAGGFVGVVLSLWLISWFCVGRVRMNWPMPHQSGKNREK